MNRRSFLRASAVAVPAAGLALTPVVAPAATLEENPDLLRLAPDLDAAEATLVAADERRKAALNAYAAIEPVVPDALIISRGDFNFYSSEVERDFDHRPLYRGPKSGMRNVLTARGCVMDVEHYGSQTARGREAARLYKIAKSYEDARDQAQEETGLIQADRERNCAVFALDAIATKIGDAEARTIAGLQLKAHAFLAMSKISEENRIIAACRWGAPLAEAVARLDQWFAEPPPQAAV